MSSSTIFETPISAPSTTLSDPPAPPSAPGRSRQPIESAKTVLAAEIFQRKHVREFAHLHDEANTSDLAAEQRILEEERRAGRRKRESLALGESGRENMGLMSPPPMTGRAMSVDGAPGRNGKRPLSLVQKAGKKGHARSRTDVGLGIDCLSSDATATVQQRTRSRPVSLRASTLGPAVTLRSKTIPEDQALEVLVEREGSVEPDMAMSHGHAGRFSDGQASSNDHSTSSGAKSTYSWATSFSGETTELRAAAHYVPSRNVTPDPDTSVELDSPARKEQRKKRIVAIAHTVRQLEGVGSRDLEDPTFYGVLAKAWYERFDDKVKDRAADRQLGSPPMLPPTPHGDAPAPFLPDSQYAEGSQSALRRFPRPRRASLPGATFSPDEFASPPDPEFKTPHSGYEFASAHHSYPAPEQSESRGASLQSKSVRYSYASSLHDLGVEGMMQGDKLLREKAWLRRISKAGTPWGGDFDMPPPLRAPTPQEEQEHEEVSMRQSGGSSALDSPFEYDSQLSQPKILRRIDGHIARPIATRRVVSTEKEVLESPAKITGESPHWGLGGLVSNWWDSTPPTRAPSPDRPAQPDFHCGEDGKIPFTRPTRKSMSNLPAVLDPNISTPSLNIHSGNSSLRSRSLDMSVRLSPSAKMFINSLVRVPSRRRSAPQQVWRVDVFPSDAPRLSRNRSLRHRRRHTEPVVDLRLIESRTGSACSSRYPVRLAEIPSTTSSPVFLVPPPSAATVSASTHTGTASTPTEETHEVKAEVLEEEDMEVLRPEVDAAEGSEDEDGLIGLETWSLRSMSPLPTPPRDEAPFVCQIPPIYPLPTIPRTRERPNLTIPIPPRFSGSHLAYLQQPPSQPTIEESEDSWSATGHRISAAEPAAMTLPIPYRHLATPTLSNCRHPDSELLSCLPWCGPACPLREGGPSTPTATVTSPTLASGAVVVRPPLPARFSSLQSPTMAWAPSRPDRPASASVEDLGLGLGLGLAPTSGPSITRGMYDAPRRPDAIRTGTMTSMSGSSGSPRDWRMTRSPVTRIAIGPEPKQRKATKLFFWLGFILPVLWFFGAWPPAPEEDEEAQSPTWEGKPSRGARVVARLRGVRERPTARWRRWAWHPDVYVERSRWAVGIAVPLCLVAGAIVAIVLSV